MPKTLIGARPVLETDLRIILQKAAFEAFMTANVPGGESPEVSGYVTNAMTDAATKFSNKFAEEAYKPLANAIYNFVKEIGITAVPTTLMSPHGPVTGSIKLNEFTIT